ncbi:MAG: kynureninase [Candidatus Limnocylindrales bacterium]
MTVAASTGIAADRFDEAYALELDAADPMTPFRDRFELPVGEDGQPSIYVCGHSLGPLPKAARTLVEEELDAWSKLGIDGHFRDEAPWFTYSDLFDEPTARLVGAKPSEVVTMNGLTVNLHVLLSSFYRPSRERFKVLIEEGAFPSDRYAIQTHLRQRGVDPAEALVLARPRQGEDSLRSEDIEGLIADLGPSLALVWLPVVQYFTGQVIDVPRLTRAGHAVGSLVGWDLAHAAGNVPTQLHGWEVDFAVWCTYKYMNGGPGSIGQAFVHERWHADPSVIRSAGWWGNDPETRFSVPFEFEPRPGAAGWQASNPAILAMAPLRASLALFDEAGMDALRERSIRLTGYLQALLDETGLVETVTPRGANARGAMLSIRVRARPRETQQALQKRGVILDFREPDAIRLAPAALYTTFHEVWRLVQVIREAA